MMKATATAFTLFSVQITWLQLGIACGVLLALYILLGLVREKKPRIRIRQAFSDAFRTALSHFGGTMKFLLAGICLLGICLAPLLLLAEMPLPVPLILTGLCWLLLMNPVRANAAAVMQRCLGDRESSLASPELIRFSGWPGKVGQGLIRAGLLAVWSLPLALALNYAWRLYRGEDDMDGFKLLQSIQDFGNGDVKDGIRYLLLILGGLILILLIGFAFHSGARHARALGNPRLVNGHRGKLVLGWFLSGLILMLPLWIPAVIAAIQVVPLLNDPNGLVAGTVKIPRLKQMILTLGIGGALTVPLLPVRSLVTAAMVRQLAGKESGIR